MIARATVLAALCFAAGTATAGPLSVAPPADWVPRDPAAVPTMGVEKVGKESVLRAASFGEVAQADLALEPGKTYVASVRVRGVGTTPASRGQLMLEHTSGGKKRQLAASRFDAAGDEWQTLRIEFTAQAEAPLASVQLNWDASADKAGSFLFAGASLTSEGGKNLLENGDFKKTAKKVKSESWFKLALPKVVKPPKGGEFAVNGGFEARYDGGRKSLGVRNWETFYVYVHAGKLAIPAECHAGSSCIRFQAIRSKLDQHTALFAQAVPVRAGKIYRLSAWVKAPDAKDVPAPAALDATWSAQPGVVRLVLPAAGKVAEMRVARDATAWQQVSAEIAVTRDYTAAIEVEGYLTVDDISLVEIPALSAPAVAPAAPAAPATP